MQEIPTTIYDVYHYKPEWENEPPIGGGDDWEVLRGSVLANSEEEAKTRVSEFARIPVEHLRAVKWEGTMRDGCGSYPHSHAPQQ